jgi:hypothetical protein
MWSANHEAITAMTKDLLGVSCGASVSNSETLGHVKTLVRTMLLR